jgi:hypothetical protein
MGLWLDDNRCPLTISHIHPASIIEMLWLKHRRRGIKKSPLVRAGLNLFQEGDRGDRRIMLATGKLSQLPVQISVIEFVNSCSFAT